LSKIRTRPAIAFAILRPSSGQKNVLQDTDMDELGLNLQQTFELICLGSSAFLAGAGFWWIRH
jgi:hypothetical protein